jgi:hypothetical protein
VQSLQVNFTPFASTFRQFDDDPEPFSATSVGLICSMPQISINQFSHASLMDCLYFTLESIQNGVSVLNAGIQEHKCIQPSSKSLWMNAWIVAIIYP